MRDIQKKIFISHSSDDEETVSKFEEIFEGLKDFEIFYSSKPEIGIEAGEELLSRIDVELEKCDYFFMIVTDSYLRSKYCLYEFNIAQYLYKKNIIEKIIPIFKNSEMQDYVSEFIPNTLFIDASNSNCASVFLKTMQTIFLITDFESESIIDKVETFFTKLNNTTVCNRNFIGMSFDEFNDIFLACRKNGITRISNSFFDSEYVKDNANQVDEIIILSTTGTALIKSIANTIINPALKNGAKIKVLIPNQHSDFCNDVADIELPQDEQHLRRKSIADEYDATINFLIEQYLKVQSELGDKKPAGSIICYCTFNILRQTIFLTKKGECLWGWFTPTTPPNRTSDDKLLFELQGMDKDSSFANTLYKHCKEIIKLAEMKKSWFDISAITQSKPFYLEYEHAKKYWKEKNESAKNLMQQRGSVYDSILIEVAAQHPLKRNDEPNREFKQRLDIAVELYFKYKKLGAGVNIYVPGSIHKKDGVCDNISLSSAGVQYLKDKKNIPQEDLFGDDMNQKYKGEAGVYNSADECFVAAQIFKNGDYDHLFCVCSPNQVTRKTLFYLDFGVYPQCYSVPCDNMFHDIVYELFDNIKYVLYSNDHSWQDENSEPYKNSRLERKP